MDGIAVALISAFGAIVAAAIAGRRTRKTRPERDSIHVGTLNQVIDRLDGEISRAYRALDHERAERAAEKVWATEEISKRDALIAERDRRIVVLERQLASAHRRF